MDSTVTLRAFRNRPTVIAAALLLATAMFVVLLARGASANPATVSETATTLTYTALAGETNNLVITVSGPTFVVVDTVTITATAPCANTTTMSATCPTSGITSVAVSLNDMSDSADLSGIGVAATIDGGAGTDALTGTTANDTLIGGPGPDTLDGKAGTDTADYSSSPAGVTVTVNATSGNTGGDAAGDSLSNIENLTGSAFTDSLTGDAAVNTLKGGDGNDHLNGAGGNDTENGEAGDDTFDQGATANGSDTLNGGAGTDLANYALRTAAVTVTLNNTGDDGETGEGDNVGADGLVENVNTGSGNDSITGNVLANTFNAGNGDDTESGGDGDDTFLEGTAANGKDVLNGDAGMDTANYSSRTANLTITLDGQPNDGEGTEGDNVGGTGNTVENVIAGSGNDTLAGNVNGNALTGGPGNDTVDYSAAPSPGVKVNLAITTPQNTIGSGVDTLVTVENLIGSAFADILTGDNGPNVLTGGLGNDMLDGGLGADVLHGGDGIDTATYASRVNAVSVTLDGLANDGESGEGDNVEPDVENVTGGNANDVLTGNAVANILRGTGGDDTLRGKGGDDRVVGGRGQDFVKGGPGNDVLLGLADNDTLIGGVNDDVLRGGGGNDLLKGGPGNDTLFGGPGNDTCLQGSGSGSLHSC